MAGVVHVMGAQTMVHAEAALDVMVVVTPSSPGTPLTP